MRFGQLQGVVIQSSTTSVVIIILIRLLYLFALDPVSLLIHLEDASCSILTVGRGRVHHHRGLLVVSSGSTRAPVGRQAEGHGAGRRMLAVELAIWALERWTRLVQGATLN